LLTHSQDFAGSGPDIIAALIHHGHEIMRALDNKEVPATASDTEITSSVTTIAIANSRLRHLGSSAFSHTSADLNVLELPFEIRLEHLELLRKEDPEFLLAFYTRQRAGLVGASSPEPDPLLFLSARALPAINYAESSYDEKDNLEKGLSYD
jgi:hypothetical protein